MTPTTNLTAWADSLPSLSDAELEALSRTLAQRARRTFLLSTLGRAYRVLTRSRITRRPTTRTVVTRPTYTHSPCPFSEYPLIPSHITHDEQDPTLDGL